MAGKNIAEILSEVLRRAQELEELASDLIRLYELDQECDERRIEWSLEDLPTLRVEQIREEGCR